MPKKGGFKMLSDSQINSICRVFNCTTADVEKAREKGEKLMMVHGPDGIMDFFTTARERLSIRENWDSYDKVALIEMVFKESRSFSLTPDI
ncbi:MAG TPA: hypothetical protein VKO42_01860 [Patescibacteria group bacterium]|nr:hypothetical protein [Patescibacteria group bacterium]